MDGRPLSAYGFCVTLGYVCGALWLYLRRKDVEGTEGEFWALAYTILFSALLGARLGSFLFNGPGGGWVFWPGFAAAMLGGWIFQQVYNRLYRPRRYLPVADLFAAALALGHALGRVGCFFEGCCHGSPTSMPWGIRFTDPGSSVAEGLLGVPLHPAQLYEASGEIAIFWLLSRKALPAVRGGRLSCGTPFFGYILLYSLLRFAVEFFRGDDRGSFLLPWLSPSQWLSLAGIAVAAAVLLRRGISPRGPESNSLYL
jgi:phosphatidylglycerol:prolipoprotein diacylglycerol transferase